MNIANLTKLEMTVEGKVFHFICDQDAPLHHAKTAILKFLGHCLDVEKAAEAATQAAQAAVEEVPSPAPEEPKQEVTP